MKKTKLFSLLLACVLMLGALSACGGNSEFNMPKGDTIKVTVSVYNDPRQSDPENEDLYTDEDVEYLVPKTEIETDYTTVLGVMNQVLTNSGLSFEISQDGATFSSIGTYMEIEPTTYDGYGYCWSFRVGSRTGGNAQNTQINDGDTITFYYEAYENEGISEEDLLENE